MYTLNSLILRDYLELPCNNCDVMPKEIDIKNMLEYVNYIISDAISSLPQSSLPFFTMKGISNDPNPHTQE